MSQQTTWMSLFLVLSRYSSVRGTLLSPSHGYFRFKSTSKAPALLSHSRPALLPTPPPLLFLDASSDNPSARAWVEVWNTAECRQALQHAKEVELTFARSSGPGGQNVNKVNTKATLRVPLTAEWIPRWAEPHLRKSPAYVASKRSLLVTSDAHRTQSRNIEECMGKLHALVLAASSAPLKNEPTKEQRDRVRGLEKAHQARVKVEKMRRSQVKQLRRRFDDD